MPLIVRPPIQTLRPFRPIWLSPRVMVRFPAKNSSLLSPWVAKWPARRGTHADIELVQKLSVQHAFAWRDIESIKVSTGPVHRMLLEPAERKWAPRNLIDAKFSIPFTVAVAVVRGDVSLNVLNDEILQDPDVLSLAEKVEAEERNDWGREHAAAGEIRLRLKKGQTLHAAVAHALGHPGSPLSTERLVEKFIRCCGHSAHPPGD